MILKTIDEDLDVSYSIRCNCGTDSHYVNIVTWGKEDPDICISVSLEDLPFSKRLINGIKYIFGIKKDHYVGIISTKEELKSILKDL